MVGESPGVAILPVGEPLWNRITTGPRIAAGELAVDRAGPKVEKQINIPLEIRLIADLLWRARILQWNAARIREVSEIPNVR